MRFFCEKVWSKQQTPKTPIAKKSPKILTLKIAILTLKS